MSELGTAFALSDYAESRERRFDKFLRSASASETSSVEAARYFLASEVRQHRLNFGSGELSRSYRSFWDGHTEEVAGQCGVADFEDAGTDSKARAYLQLLVYAFEKTKSDSPERVSIAAIVDAFEREHCQAKSSTKLTKPPPQQVNEAVRSNQRSGSSPPKKKQCDRPAKVMHRVALCVLLM